MSPLGAIGLALLTVYAWPLVRFASRPVLRRVAPGHFALLLTLSSSLVVAAVAVAWLAPLWALGVALALLPLAVASWWRGGDRFGASRGLPPGSLAFWRSIEALVDRSFYLRQTRRHGPLFKSAQFHRGVVCVVGLEWGQRLLREHGARLGPSRQPFDREVSGGFLRYMDDETHRDVGARFRTALATPVVMASEELTRQVVRQELDGLAQKGEDEAVSPESALERIVHRAFLAVLFGVRAGSPAGRRFEALYAPFGQSHLGAPLRRDARAALEALRAWVADRVPVLDEEGAPSTSVLAEMVDRRGEAEVEAVVVDNLLFIFKISTGNVVALLRWLLEMLRRHPAWIERLRREILVTKDLELSRLIVLETLRLAQSEYLYRDIVETFRFDGFTLPRGWLLRICVRESHLDPAIFPRPEQFDPERFRRRRFQAAEFSPFGFGAHRCNGATLTMMIARSFLEELASRFEVEIEGDELERRELRHWAHWRPADSLALRLERLRAAEADDVPVGGVA